MSPFPAPRLTAIALILALPAAPVLAQTDGTWRCKIIGDIPVGLLQITGTAYVFTETDTSFAPRGGGSSGGGTLMIEGEYLIPQNGPLVTEFGVTGALDGQGAVLGWNNNSGRLMSCAR